MDVSVAAHRGCARPAAARSAWLRRCVSWPDSLVVDDPGSARVSWRPKYGIRPSLWPSGRSCSPTSAPLVTHSMWSSASGNWRRARCRGGAHGPAARAPRARRRTTRGVAPGAVHVEQRGAEVAGWSRAISASSSATGRVGASRSSRLLPRVGSASARLVPAGRARRRPASWACSWASSGEMLDALQVGDQVVDLLLVHGAAALDAPRRHGRERAAVGEDRRGAARRCSAAARC